MPLDAVHEKMCSGLEQDMFTAAVLQVIRKGRILFHGAYGTLGGQGTPEADTQTLFDMASVTKILATTPLWMLLESESPGIIDENLTRWFPEAPPDKSSITPRHLLAHASGLPAWRPYYLMGSGSSHSASVRARILSEVLAYPIGRGCIYSDLGFMLLGFMLEKETGRSLKECAREMMYEPLGLEDMLFRPADRAERIALTRFGDATGLVNDLNARALGGVAGHAGLFATADAAGRLALEIMRSYLDRGFFKTSVIRRFCARPGFTADSTRALGFDTPAVEGSSCGRFFSRRSVGHTGFTGVSLWMDMEREAIGVLLTNRVVKGESDFRIKDFRPSVYDAVMSAVVDE
ncbi:MAG TPA: serine hydrolase domain-containing protein [Desulfomonilaceae bacterium]|nr:serine hydrolase domain-containing protein [Desulfomonilaceae bacterium]